MAAGKRWTGDELFVALNLYHKLTFGQLHARQPAIIALAEKLGRGSNSVAMKLCNLASLDPALKLRGIKGLDGASALDREVWNEFHRNLNEAVPFSEEALRKLFGVDEGSELEVLPREGVRVRKRPPTGPTESTASVKQRRGQEYFRDAVLNNFGGRCGVTGLGGRCVFSSDWDKFSRQTYAANFGETPHGDSHLAENARTMLCKEGQLRQRRVIGQTQRFARMRAEALGNGAL